ncbi:AraC family transcriptional regulator [Desnuesiella massiliensis]|uniref:AraC family transcriptional regulator n=1 Tax=Desnuesiella massiliensis TaxID=1650662 RepID=UPI0006E39028|nr:AraC family transcriptional regulator [Desnuesiella massiliensis]
MYTEKNTLRETVDRGDAVIPFYIYHHYWSQYNLYLHWHNEFEIIYMEKGFSVFTVDTLPIKVSAGQCIIVNSGQLHSAHCMNNEFSQHHALLFDLNFLSGISSDYCHSKYIAPLLKGQFRLPLIVDEKSQWGSEVIREVREAIKIYDSKELGWEIGIKASLYKILSFIARENKFLIEESSTTSSINYKINIIKKSLNYIQNNYTKKIYIEDLANEVNMNPQYFCRFFKKNIGKTPVDYINQYRIEQAVKIIKTEDKNISDICFEVGFDNFSYFIRKFKQYKNCTPNKYKQLF